MTGQLPYDLAGRLKGHECSHCGSHNTRTVLKLDEHTGRTKQKNFDCRDCGRTAEVVFS